MRKLAFTMFETILVIVLLGLLSAILFPMAINSLPDSNKIKFKKAHASLANVIHELAINEKYYARNNLAYKPNGTLVNDAKYLCNSIANVLNVKSYTCSNVSNGSLTTTNAVRVVVGSSDLATQKTNLDTACATYTNAGNEIVLTDGVVIYQPSPAYHFGVVESGKTIPYFIETVNTRGFYSAYKTICIDVDGIGVGEAPFGYGIRVDGKILNGTRADNWIGSPSV